jgi:hypothetical protein
MLHLRKDRWIGNAWASIHISPNDETCFLRILAYLAHRYGFPFPHVSDLIDATNQPLEARAWITSETGILRVSP